MLQYLIEGVAGFIGGYLGELVENKRISITKQFFYSFFLMLFICIAFCWVSKNFELNNILIGLLISFIIAVTTTLLTAYIYHRKKNN